MRQGQGMADQAGEAENGTVRRSNDALSICKLDRRALDRVHRRTRRKPSVRQRARRPFGRLRRIRRKALATGPSLELQEAIKATLESASGSFQRLKLVMDSWCSLWCWPLDRVVDLPTRAGFLTSARLLLGANRRRLSYVRSLAPGSVSRSMRFLAAADGRVPDTVLLADAVPWYEVAQRLVGRARHFHHWELVLPEVLGRRYQRNGLRPYLGKPTLDKG